MGKKNEAKEKFGAWYYFKRYMGEGEIKAYLTNEKRLYAGLLIASLIVGNLRIDAVLYRENGAALPMYEVFVRDRKDSPEWICYDSPGDAVSYSAGALEEEMFMILDRIRDETGLSYIGCNFGILEGKRISAAKKKK